MAFLSDVHGNLEALEAVLSELARRDVTTVYVAGDLVLGGDAPLEVWRRLLQVGAKCARGLSDTALATIDPSSLSPRTDEEKERVERFRETRAALGELVLEQIRRLPERIRVPLIDGREILVVHGSPNDPRQEISHDMEDDEVRALVDDDVADIVVCGASHVPFRIDLGETQVVSVGSVGEAPEGRVAHFAVITPRMDGAEIHQDFVEY